MAYAPVASTATAPPSVRRRGASASEPAEPAPTSVSVREVHFPSVDPISWDLDAERAGAPLRSAYTHLAGTRLRCLFRQTVRTFEVGVAADGQFSKIGLFSIIQSRKTFKFYDGISLLPEYRRCWPNVMEAALAHLGPGHYEYGWRWSLEPGREDDLSAMAGVEVESVQRAFVQAIDFAQWASWDEYYRNVSENSKRNAKKATSQFKDLSLGVKTGRSTVQLISTITSLRDAMYRRKQLPFRPMRIALGYLVNFLTIPRQAEIAYASVGRRVLAAYRISQFHSLSYYLDGATARDAGGAGWNLMLALVRRQYDRTPKGKFLVGYYDDPPTPDLALGLLRARRALRVSNWPTSIVAFRYREPA